MEIPIKLLQEKLIWISAVCPSTPVSIIRTITVILNDISTNFLSTSFGYLSVYYRRDLFQKENLHRKTDATVQTPAVGALVPKKPGEAPRGKVN